MDNTKDLFNLDILDNVDDKGNDFNESADLMSVSFNLNETPEGDSTPPPHDTKHREDAKDNEHKGVAIPKTTEIPLSVYNQAIAALQKNINEVAEISAMLDGSTIAFEETGSTDVDMDEANEFLENAIYNAMISGPFFEAVKAEDKDDVKKIVANIIKKLPDAVKEVSARFIKPSWIARSMLDPIFGLSSTIVARWHNKMWQIAGIVYCNPDDITTVTDKLNEEFAELCGEYKLIHAKLSSSLSDMVRSKFNYNKLHGYLLVVDKKLPSEIKKLAAAEPETKKDK